MSQFFRIVACVAVLGIAVPAAHAAGPVNGSHQPGKTVQKDGDLESTLEQKFLKRYPQPARVGHLIGMPVLDENDSTIGYVTEVVRGADGKVFLIVPYSAWFGWLRHGWNKRPVAVPIEAVALLGWHIDSLDMSRDDLNAAPTWTPSQGQLVPPDEETLIALQRR